MLCCFSVTGPRSSLSSLKDDIVKSIDSAAKQTKKWYNYISHLDLSVEQGSITTTFKDQDNEAFCFITMVNEELIITLMSTKEDKKKSLAANAAKGLIKSCIFISGLNFTEDEKQTPAKMPTTQYSLI